MAIKNLQDIIPAMFTGPSGERLTPEQIAQRQQIAQSLIGRATDTSPDAGGWASVLTKGLLGYKSGADTRAADAAIKANADASQQSIAQMLGSLTGGGSAYPSAVASGASPTSAAATGTQTTINSLTPLAEGAEWLQYANQNATRNQPINDKLVSALSFLPEIGVTMRVVSGGQDAKGTSSRRVGSTRHDHGNAADVDFYIGDRKLTPNNEQDRAILSQIVQRGRAAGVTGWGEGDDYMGSGRVHLGFGSEGVWGAGGKGANAPEWLRTAFNTPYQQQVSAGQQAINAIAPIEQGDENPSAGITPIVSPDGSYVDPIVSPVQENAAPVVQETFAQPPSMTAAQSNLLAQNDIMLGGALSPTGTSPVAQALSGYFPDAPTMQEVSMAAQPSVATSQPSASGGVNPAIIQALSDPYASPQQRQIASLLLGNQMEAVQKQQQQQQLMQQRMATAQTLGINPALAGDPDAWKAAIDRANRGRNTVTVGNTVYDVETGQPIIQGQSDPTSDIQNYEYARNNGFKGSFEDYQQQVKRAGATTVDARQMGNIPPGYKVDYNDAGQPVSMSPIPGSPDYIKAQREVQAFEQGKVSKERTSQVVTQDIDRAMDLIDKSPLTTTGVAGTALSKLGGTASNDVNQLITTIKANAGFDRLQAMRDASPTGGALGAVSERELTYLQSTIGSLDQSQTKDQLIRNLKRVRQAYSDIIDGPKKNDDSKEQEWRDLGNGVRIRVKGAN